MTAFSEKLSDIIKNNKINVAQLSRKIGIDRTTIEKYKSGARKQPDEQQFETLLEAMALSPSEQEDLRQAYEISNKDPQSLQRKKVQEIMEGIAEVYSMTPSNYLSANKPDSDNFSFKETEKFSGKRIVKNTISEVILGEDEILYFSMPYDNESFYESLFLKYSSCASISIHCFISFVKSKAIMNLDILETVMPFLMSDKNHFQAHYVYSDTEKQNFSTMPLPYFIHTRQHTLLLSSKLDCAILTKNPEIRGCYQDTCEKFVKSAKPLLNRINGPDELLKYYLNNYLGHIIPKKIELAGIEFQPCLLIYVGLSMLQKYSEVLQNNETILSDFKNYVDRIQQEVQGKLSVFTEDGLGSFIKTGKLSVIPPDYITAFDKQDRLNLLEKMLEDLTKDKIKFRLIDSTKFTIADGFSIGCLNGHSLLISDLRYKTGNTKVISIGEQSIVDAFLDFFNSIPDSELVLSKEATIQAIHDAIRDLNILLPD